MLEIVTTTGVSLDMEKDLDIQVELEQPLLDADHLPVAYSTEISFPFTDTNKTAFGFVPAMMLEPSVKQLDARILFYGRELFSGSLVYDGVEDGKLRYIFTENSLREWLDEDVAPFSAETVTWDQMQVEGAKYRMPIIGNKAFATWHVEPGNVAGSDEYWTYKDIKYRNCIYGNNSQRYSFTGDFDKSCDFLPAVRILSLLDRLTIRQQDNDMELVKRLYMLCSYGRGKIESVAPSVDEMTHSDLRNARYTHETQIDKSRYPDVSRADLIDALCPMICAAVYKERNDYLLIAANSLFIREEENTNVLFWDEKVADIYGLFREKKKNYRFGYSDDETLGDDSSFEHILSLSVYNLLELDLDDKHYKLRQLYTSADVVNALTVFSSRAHEEINSPFNARTYDTDILYRNRGKAERQVGAEEGFEQTSEFIPVETTPERFIDIYDGTTDIYDFRAPLVELPAEDDGRGDKMIIGIMTERDHNGNGQVFQGHPLPSLVEKGELESELSLLPPDLYNSYHKSFAEWMGTDRTGVKVDLDLTVDDLTELALYKRVNFRGRDWMIKRLSLTFHTDGGHFEATGEFISL